ncbi:rubrerythrin family protein [Candidatus Peregrinibacteria bacterium]|nr:rubrerythrin family protein [Candidatus Peregrinibacteria bacterium]
MTKKMPDDICEKLLIAQKSEISEHIIYKRLAKATKNQDNSKILKKISDDELKHYNFWKKYTHKDVKPNRWQINKFYWITRILGLTFGIRLMESGEARAQINYEEFIDHIPEAKEIIKDEERHEQDLINCINEEKLEFVGSAVLGLNDALVEITGTLAGLTFALQNTRLVGVAGLITGIAASLSMAASEYLSQRADESEQAFKSSIYTGVAYIFTVVFLILPYFLFENIYFALATTSAIVITIIAIFNFYISVAKNYNFKKRFFEMVTISGSVAVLSFLIGLGVRMFLNVEV